MKYKKTKFVGLFVIGLISGVLMMVWVPRQQVKLRFDFKDFPPNVEIDPCGPPHQISISFGTSPSDWSFGKALKMIEDRTAGGGTARILVDLKLYTSELAKKRVRPPSGYQPSLELVKQIIASADVTDKVQICLIPEGGYRVCMR